ncbi:MAG: NADH-quinone oxidoreductase subunit NuoE [bacterium]
MKLFDHEQIKKMEDIVARYEVQASAIMPLLHFVQETKGHLEEEHLVFVADFLDIPHVRAFEVATYYTMYFTKPIGKYLIQVCRNLSCSINGAPEVIEAIRENLKVELGEMTADGLFTIVEVECIGACDLAPAVMINEKLFGKVSTDSISGILDSYREKAQDA